MKWLLFLVCASLASAQANTLQDPTKPKPSSSLSNSDKGPKNPMQVALKLTAIIDNNQFKQAIINGRSVVEGQLVQGYKVVLISQGHVVLDGSKGKQMLYVNNNNIKKDTNNGF